MIERTGRAMLAMLALTALAACSSGDDGDDGSRVLSDPAGPTGPGPGSTSGTVDGDAERLLVNGPSLEAITSVWICDIPASGASIGVAFAANRDGVFLPGGGQTDRFSWFVQGRDLVVMEFVAGGSAALEAVEFGGADAFVSLNLRYADTNFDRTVCTRERASATGGGRSV